MNDKTIAIEIETGKSDAVANIRKCLEAGSDAVLSVATTSQVKKVIGRETRDLNTKGQIVQVLTAREVLEHPGAPFHF